MPAQIGRVQYKKDGFRLRQPFHLAEKHVVRDALVLGARIQAINSGKIDHEHFAAGIELDLSHAVLDRHTWEIRHLLAKTRQPIEQGRFAGIRWADNRNQTLLGSGKRGWGKGRYTGRTIVA